MNSGATSERVHDGLRRQIMDRAFGPGERLDPTGLAERLHASTTPVREALYQLLGEALVETRIGGGFQVTQLDEPRLKDMYAWSSEILILSIRSWASAPIPISLIDTNAPGCVSTLTGSIFLEIARRSINREHLLAVDRLSARLHAVRRVESNLLNDVEDEVLALADLLANNNRSGLRKLLTSYHRRRRRVAAEIVHFAHRAEDFR